MVRKTSRLTEAIVGVIMMARMKPAARRLAPLADMGPAKRVLSNGIWPKVSARNCPVGVTTTGRNTKIPHRP